MPLLKPKQGQQQNIRPNKLTNTRLTTVLKEMQSILKPVMVSHFVSILCGIVLSSSMRVKAEDLVYLHVMTAHIAVL